MSSNHRLSILVGAAVGVCGIASGAPPAVTTPLEVAGAKPGFVLVHPGSSGVLFTNHLAQHRHLTNQILLNGSGVTAGDVNGDGLSDLYFCGLDGPNVLYLNLGGWRFRDISRQAGVSCPDLDASSAAFADLDGDGDLDLLVSSVGGGTRLFLNDGTGRFTAHREVLNANRAGTSMALADLDGNGTLDLYVANYRTVTLRDQPNTAFRFKMVDGKPEVSAINGRPLTEPDLTNRFSFQIKVENGRVSFSSDEHGEPDAIFLNDGRGHFSPLSFTRGAFLDEDGMALRAPPFDWGLSVMLRDLDGNGSPDIYVCNDFKSPDRIWINRGLGKFHAVPKTAIRQTSLSSMGLDLADINRDGHFDIFVVDMLSREHRRRLSQKPDVNPDVVLPGDTTSRVQSARNTMLLSRGDGTFAEVAQFAGLDAAEWAWTPAFLDVDLDGFEDLLISNGFERDGMNVDALREIERRKAAQKLSTIEQLGLRKLFPRLDTPNAAFRNLGKLRFHDVSDEWGFNAPAVSQGLALADLDGDGDLDVVLNNLNGPAMLYRNEGGAPRVAVRLEGAAPNTRGVGAKITVLGGPVTQSQEMICGGRYLSSDDFIRTFAAGSATNRLRIEVAWRSGKRSVVEDVPANHLCTIREAAADAVPARPPASVRPLFQDVSANLRHRHVDLSFDDFARQPLLPGKLSQAGPGVGWFDIDGDGWDDLIIGSGSGGRFGAYLNQRNGAFRSTENRPIAQGLTRDHSAILGWRRSPAEAALLAASSSYEDLLSAGGSAIRQFDLAGQRVLDLTAPPGGSPGPLCMADVDADGDLDLFAGGGVLPGRYPHAAPSTLYQNDNGVFSPEAVNSRVFTNAGIVNGAVFSDIDADGDPDLLLACEWGPIRLFENRAGSFREITSHSGLEKYRGWWNGVAVGDFDADGRLDIVASNRGENTRYKPAARPLRIYYADFEGDQVGEVIEAHYDEARKAYVPSRNLEVALRGMPWLRARFPTWGSFSTATVEEMLGANLPAAGFLEANWAASTVFLNRGEHFEAIRLPDEAQFSPAFGIGVADFNGDAHEDIFLGQNFFSTPLDTSRHDAGRGLLLLGNGQGGFTSLNEGSGIAVHGEQRGVAVGDFDRDGRVDIVVTQHAAETRLFRNLAAKPGLRVRLAGSKGNPDGIGATVRLGVGQQFGAARELHAGSGYLSQDSAVPVLARTGSRLMVRWPGGKTTVSDVPAEANEVEVDESGAIQVRR